VQRRHYAHDLSKTTARASEKNAKSGVLYLTNGNGSCPSLATILFLVSGGQLILIPLLFVPLGLLSLRRGRHYLAALRTARPPNVRSTPS